METLLIFFSVSGIKDKNIKMMALIFFKFPFSNNTQICTPGKWWTFSLIAQTAWEIHAVWEYDAHLHLSEDCEVRVTAFAGVEGKRCAISKRPNVRKSFAPTTWQCWRFKRKQEVKVSKNVPILVPSALFFILDPGVEASQDQYKEKKEKKKENKK